MPEDTLMQPSLDEPHDLDASQKQNSGSGFDLTGPYHAGIESRHTRPPTAETNPRHLRYPSEITSLPSIPGYTVEAVLGVGGMGVVYRARHLRLNRTVALKMALALAHAGHQERERFQREVEAVAALRHPNVVQVYDVGDVEGQPYFTMEYFEGGNLNDKLVGSPLLARESAKMIATLAAAIHTAHTCGIVHRDLKPANIFLTADGTPKIGDFGLARRLDGEAGLTRSGIAVGTPSYMAPEQAGEATDVIGPSADVYALGAILYELLTGQPPFCAGRADVILYQLLTRNPLPPSQRNAKVPRDLETICMKCLQKEPRLRYASASALGDDLERYLRGEAIAARPESRLRSLVRQVRRRPVLSTALAVATLSTVSLVIVWLWMLSDRAASRRAMEVEWTATERAAEDDLKEVTESLQQAAWSRSRVALERVKGRLGDRGSIELRRRLDQSIRDLQLGERLEEIRVDAARSLAGFGLGRCSEEYEEAFRSAGLGEPGDDPHVVARRISESNISSALIAALDHWSSLAGNSRQGWILEVARLADQGQSRWRDQARDPAVRADSAAFAQLVEAAPVADQPVSLLLALDNHLSRRGKERLPFLKRVQQAHAGDVWANMTLGDVLSLVGEHGEAVRYYQAAVAVRPRLALSYHHLGFALFAAGRPEDAIEPLRQAVALDPTAAPSARMLDFLLTRLGRQRAGPGGQDLPSPSP